MHANVGKICSAGQTSDDQCPEYENVYTKATTQTVVLDFSPECYAAKAAVPRYTAKLKAARKALERAKAAHKPVPVIRKKKRAVAGAKAKLVKARSDVEGPC
ncbi:MAG: hypothetical protein JWN68_2034 [Nocardioides sp.]|jgi:hypothetical protein|uniref:hypothetical protein n=1 Tax=Nocardioides sp. TaxID=35761 RepID=UPI002629B037|nr:hypothetical protein [Nocardioides sp.]MCW2834081.1 hypothetical protein [Nocardioides sp.]